MVWREFDYRTEDLAGSSVWTRQMCDVPLYVDGETIRRRGDPWVANGIGFSPQSIGSYYGSQSASAIDTLLDKLKHVGINAASIYGMENLALCSSGTFNGRPIGCWASGAFAAYNSQFWSGDGTSAGLDYFFDALRKRGMYAAWRINDWNNVFTGKGATAPSGNTIFQGLYHFDGAGGTPTLKTYMKAHLAQFLNWVNTVNGIRYGADYTLAFLNLLNEQGHMRFYHNTSSASSPTNNTFDLMCKNGTAPASTYVTAIDADWVSWHTTTFGSGPTVNGAASTAMPCYAYTGSMGSGIAARTTFNVKANMTDTERQRIARYWSELEAGFHTEIKAYIKSLAPHVLYICGTRGYHFHTTEAVNDVQDYHDYHQTTSTTGNWQTIDDGVSGQTAKGNWAAGTLTVTLGGASAPDGNHTLVTGQMVRITRKSGSPAFSQVLAITQTSAVTFTVAIADPSFGVNEPLTIVLPGRAGNDCLLHSNPPTDNTAGSTRTYQTLSSGGETQVVDVASFPGHGNYGFYNNQWGMGQITGKPAVTTEMGTKGLTLVGHVQHPIIMTILDALQGGSGVFYFTMVNAQVMQIGEHCFQGHGTSWLLAELTSLMRRFGGLIVHPTLNETQIIDDDAYAWWSKHNLTDGYNTNEVGWHAFMQDASLGATGTNAQYDRFLRAKGRWSVQAASNKSAQPSSSPSFSAGNYLSGLSNTGVCAIYYHRNTGYLTVQTPTLQLIVGRIPASKTLSKMAVSSIDGKYWYGVVAWVSEDGTQLGDGKSRLYSMMYPRDEQQWFARCPETTNLDILDTGYGVTGTEKPGIVVRDDLEVQLTSPRLLHAYRPLGGKMGRYYTKLSGGKIKLKPRDPRILLS